MDLAQPPLTNSKVESEYRERTRRSAQLYAEACKVIPAGLTHDSRTLLPYPIYAARAAGARKWDVDGNEYVDYFGGHGALLLGHAHPAVVEAVQAQVTQGTHWGSSHEGGGALGRAREPPHPVRRARAVHGVGHRGLAPRAAARTRLHRQAEGRALRRPLPRLARSGGRPARCRISTARVPAGILAEPRRADHPAAGGRHRGRGRDAAQRATTSPP